MFLNEITSEQSPEVSNGVCFANNFVFDLEGREISPFRLKLKKKRNEWVILDTNRY